MRASTFRDSLRFAWAGWKHVLRTQRNAKIELALALAVVALAAVLGIPLGEWATIAVTIGLVLAAEMANSSVEAIVDLLSPQYDDRARIAKDAAAGAVLALAAASVVVGLVILGPPLYARLFGT